MTPLLILDSVQMWSNRIAIEEKSNSYSYEDLEQASHDIATQLSKRGIKRGDRVGLLLPRSFHLVATMLAVWRAGASWVPLDPAFPADRLLFIAQDSDLSLLVFTPDLREFLDWPNSKSFVLRNVETRPQEKQRRQHRESRCKPQDEAYVMYTSGSTGKPKGVCIPHSALSNFLDSVANTPGIREQDRLLAVTTPSFDIALLELLLPLLAGATVVIADDNDVLDGRQLTQILEKKKINVMQATASTWWMLLDAGWKGSKSFRALTGGEPLSRALGQRLASICDEAWNMYGPTETTIWSSCWKIPDRDLDYISLGAPIANTRIEILDDKLNAVRNGSPGEIVISGIGVASGYINRPEESRARFFETGDDDLGYSRHYRTGDLGRYTADGSILEFLGRQDEQLKIRGRRIELGEIEAQLQSCAEILNAAVVAHRKSETDIRLVAYLQPATSSVDTAALQRYLSTFLPDYMLPQHYIEIALLPRLTNGKIDRKSLSEMPVRVDQYESQDAPATPTELTLHEIWRSHLGLESIGTRENFFNIGGHSLLAAYVGETVRQVLGIETSDFPLLRAYPTISALARYIDAGCPAINIESLSLQSRGNRAPIFCLGGTHLFQELAREFAPDHPVTAIHVDDTRIDSLRDLAGIYVESIRQTQPQGPYCIVGFSFGGAIAHEVANRLTKAGNRIRLLVIIDGDAPGKVRDALPFRVMLRLASAVRSVSGLSGSRHKATNVNSNTRPSRFNSPHRIPGSAVSEHKTTMLKSHEPEKYSGKLLFFEASREMDMSHFGWKQLSDEFLLSSVKSLHLELLQLPHARTLAISIKHELASEP